jgi:hypothetical protein
VPFRRGICLRGCRGGGPCAAHRAIRNVDGTLPSLYKARQFGAGHHAFVARDARNLAVAVNKQAVLSQEVKELRKKSRSLQTALDRSSCDNEVLKDKLKESVPELAEEERTECRKEYRRHWMKDRRQAHKLKYIQEHVLPALRAASAAAGILSQEQTLQLVRDHIRQVILLT